MSRLPDSYQEIEYLEFQGEQYINTQVIPLQNVTKMEMKFQYTMHISNGTYQMNGVAGSSDNKYFQFFMNNTKNGTLSNKKFVFDFGNAASETEMATADLDVHVITMDAVNNQVKFDNLTFSVTSNPLPVQSIKIGNRSNNNTMQSNQCWERVFYCRIWESGTEVRNLIPCYRKSDSVLGLYDLIGDVFYTNQGSGSFLKGPDTSSSAGGKTYISPLGTAEELDKVYFGSPNNIALQMQKGFIGDQNGIARLIYGGLPAGYTRLPYLESDGEQWINTGVIPTGNTRVKIRCENFPTSNENACIFGSRIAASNNGFAIIHSNSLLKYRYNYGNTMINSESNTFLGVQTIDADKNVITITQNGNTETFSHELQTINTTYPIYLFALNQAETVTYPVAAKIYSCKIWENDLLVRDFVPCEWAYNIKGFYDLVNKKFYPMPLWIFKNGVCHSSVKIRAADNATYDITATRFRGIAKLGTSSTYGAVKFAFRLFREVFNQFDCTYQYDDVKSSRFGLGYNNTGDPYLVTSNMDLLINKTGTDYSKAKRTYSYKNVADQHFGIITSYGGISSSSTSNSGIIYIYDLLLRE